MAAIKLTRTTGFMGVNQNIILRGKILEDTDTHITVKLTESVISDLKKDDWQTGDIVSVGQELIESFI